MILETEVEFQTGPLDGTLSYVNSFLSYLCNNQMAKIGPVVLHFDRIAPCQLSRKLDAYITHHHSSPTAICTLYSVPAAVMIKPCIASLPPCGSVHFRSIQFLNPTLDSTSNVTKVTKGK